MLSHETLLTRRSLSTTCRFSNWREIALAMRDKVFEESEEQLVDIYDVEVNYFNIYIVTYLL